MEIDYYELYGVEKPEEQTENEPEEAADAGSLRSEESPDGDDLETVEEGQEDAHPEEAGQSGKKHQSREENAKFAAQRRKQERDAAIAEAVEKARAEERQRADERVNSIFQKMGVQNSYTGTDITNEAELEQWSAEHQKQQHEATLRQMGMDQTEYDQMIQNLPEVKEARQVTKQAKKEAAEKQLRAELAEVSQLNPAIRTAKDLIDDPRFEQINGYLDRGLTIPEAYRLTYMDELTAGRARQQTVNQMGKAHMTSTVSRGPGMKDVPMDVLQSFRRYLPDATPEDILDYYKRHGG